MRADRAARTGRARDDYGGGSRSRDKAADTLWGQSASQRAGVASTSLERPASLFSRGSYDAERERKRQLISKMVMHEPYTHAYVKKKCQSVGAGLLGKSLRGASMIARYTSILRG